MKIINVKSVYGELRKNIPEIYRMVSRIRSGEITAFTPPSAFVGEYNYPKIRVGVLISPENNSMIHDSPKYWVAQNYDVSKIFSLRSTIVNANKAVRVDDIHNPIAEKISFSILSKDEIDVNMKVASVNSPAPNFSEFKPNAVNATLDRLDINDNFKIDKPVEKVYYDKDLKATEGIRFLYGNSIDENKISKMLSLGTMGVKRKLVPTKWSITAVDQSIGQEYIDRIKMYEKGDDYFVIKGSFLGNVFTIVFMKGCWSYELIETWNRDGTNVMMGHGDHEFYEGRKNYVENTAGAYYAIRLAVLEKLEQLKKQYAVLVIREITPEYYAPLGVWVTREGSRKALKSEPAKFNALNDTLAFTKRQLLFPQGLEYRSTLIKSYKNQTRLTDLGY